MSRALGIAVYGVPFGGSEQTFAAPSNVSASETDATPGNRSIQLTFTAPDPAPLNYDIQRQVNYGSWATVAMATALTTFNDTGLTDGIYSYRVRANYTEGSSDYKFSNTLSAFINLYLDFSNIYHAIAEA